MPKRQNTPPKTCEVCGQLFHRKGTEVPSAFARRRVCSTACIPGLHRKPVTAESFFEQVFPEPNSGCWLWDGRVGDRGYGHIWHDGKQRRAHRVSWELHNGSAPPADRSVCHRCDVTVCVNPDHLFLGTQQENTIDMVRKGRANRCSGEQHRWARLTAEQVRDIRSDPRIHRIIAAEYGVSKSTITAVKSGQNWGGVD